MKYILLPVFVVFAALSMSHAQYKGGSNDGYSFGAVFVQNALPGIFNGGSNDGYANSLTLNQNALPGIYLGGSNDGVDLASVVGQNALPGIYLGGNNDGFSLFSIAGQNALPGIYAGGANDGFSIALAANQNGIPGIYLGGLGDGFAIFATATTNPLPGIYAGGPNDGFSLMASLNQNPSTPDACTAAIANCPTNIVVNTGPNNPSCSQVATWTPPTDTNHCPNTVITSNYLPGAAFPVGNTTVTYTFVNDGNSQTCSFVVTVIDNTAPAISGCPGNIVVNTGAGRSTCDQVATWTPPTATDNCGGVVTVTSSHLPGATFPVGTTTVIYTLKDSSANTGICSFTVTVVDNTPPVVSGCPQNISLTNCNNVASWTPPTATDNCNNVTTSSTHQPGNAFPSGTSTVTYTFTDASNNSSTCSFTVTVADNTPPVVSGCPQNITLTNCNNVATWTPPTATDNCGNVTTSSTHQPGAAFPSGTTTVTYTFTDASNNSSTCSFTVTVADNTPPVVSGCPQNITLLNCNNVATWTPPTATDNCSAVTTTSNYQPGDTFPSGTTTVTYTFTDASSNSSTCSFTVTATGSNAPPTISGCPSNITVNTGPGRITCDQTATWTPPTAVDNCGSPVTGSSTDLPGDTFPVGTTTVTYTFTSNNLTSTCSFTVTVVDNTPPVVSDCPQNITLPNCNSVATWTPPAATDNCGNVTTSSTHEPGDAFPSGTTTVTYTFTDASNNSSTCSFTVTVVDNTPPVVSGCPQNITLANCNNVATWTPPTATDNCAVTTTSNYQPGDTFPSGTTTVTYTFTDASNNSSTCSFTVTTTGSNAPPTISGCPSNITVNTGPGRITCDQTATWTPPTAVDNCGNPVTGSSTDLPGDTFPVGTTTVTYTFTSNNLTSTCSFTVTVVDDTKPVINGCPLNFAVFTGPDNTTCTQTATWTPPGVTDNCGGSVTVTSNYQPGDTFPLGSTQVLYTFVDADSNSTFCYFYVTVVDNTAPQIITPCPTDMNVFTGPNAVTCRAIVNWTPPVAMDNCSTVNTTSTHSPGASFPVGTTTVTYTFKDAKNNVTTCSFTVTVIDNAMPVAKCKPYTLNLAGGTGTVTVANINNGSIDNCAIESMTVSPSTFTCADAGVQPVVLTVTDVNGNSSTCTTNVTVRYKPTCSIAVTPSNSTYTGGVPTNIYLGYGPQSARATVTASGGSGLTYSWSPSNNLSCNNCFNPLFTPTAPGTYTYTVTVTNSNGCSTTCTVTFCVKDVRVPNSSNVYICHDGSPSTTMSVTSSQAASHLSSHPADRLGQCNETCSQNNARVVKGSSSMVGDEVKVYPNPNTGAFVVELPYIEDEQAQITVTDMQGKVIIRKVVVGKASHKVPFDLGDVARGVYFVEVDYDNQRFRTKLIVQ